MARSRLLAVEAEVEPVMNTHLLDIRVKDVQIIRLGPGT